MSITWIKKDGVERSSDGAWELHAFGGLWWLTRLRGGKVVRREKKRWFRSEAAARLFVEKGNA